MKVSMLQAINTLKDRAGEWMALPRRAWAAIRRTAKSFSPALVAGRKALQSLSPAMWTAAVAAGRQSLRLFSSTIRAVAAGRKALKLFSPALAALRGVAKSTLGFAAAIPLQVWLAAAALVVAGLWLQEHDAGVRAGAELSQTRQQTAQRVAALEAQADAALRQANQNNAAAIAQLEARRQAIAKQAANLAAQLESLRGRQTEQRAELNSLPAPQVAQRLVEKLGPSSFVPGPSSLVPGPSPFVRSPVERAGPGSGAPETFHQAVAVPPQQAPTPQQGTKDEGQMTLTELGQRQVLSALAERDACREESFLRNQLSANCEQRVAAGEAEIRTQADSIGKLNAALGAKDKIVAEREAEYRAELRAARGTWRSRAWRAMKWLAAGVMVGVALR